MNHKRFYISEAGQAEIVSFGHYGILHAFISRLLLVQACRYMHVRKT